MHAWMAMICVMMWIAMVRGHEPFLHSPMQTIECHIIFNNRDTPTIPNKWKHFNFLWFFISLASYQQPGQIRYAINFFQFLHISNYRLLLLKRKKRLNSGTTYAVVLKINVMNIWAGYTRRNFPFFCCCCFHLVLFIVITVIAFRMTFHYISPTDSLFHYIIN